MMQLRVKVPLVLLLGTFGLLTTESTSSPTPVYSTAEPNNTTEQLLLSATVHYETRATSRSAQSGAAVTEGMDGAHVTHSSSESTAAEFTVKVTTAETRTSSSGGAMVHTSAAAAAAAAALTTEVKRPNATTVPETAKPTDGEQTSNASTNMTDPAATSAATSAASSATTVSVTQPTSTKMPEVTSMLFPITSEASASKTLVTTQTQTSLQALNATTPTMSATSSGATVIDSTTQKKTTSENEPLTTSEHDSTTRAPNSTVESTKPSTGHPTDSFSTNTTNTTTNSTSSTAILIPREITTKSPATTSKTPLVTDPQSCSTVGVARHCLIVIAVLAFLATIFMVTTIVLCTKLSGRKYKMRRRQPATEMMCISSLLPERNYTYTRQRNPVSNGVLVMHTAEDSDEDGGDNLTLSSFLPENDRYV